MFPEGQLKEEQPAKSVFYRTSTHVEKNFIYVEDQQNKLRQRLAHHNIQKLFPITFGVVILMF